MSEAQQPYRCICGTLMCVRIFMRQEPCQSVKDAEKCEYAQNYAKEFNKLNGRKAEFARTLYEYKGKGHFTKGVAALTRQEVTEFFEKLPKPLDNEEIGERSHKVLLDKLQILSNQS